MTDQFQLDNRPVKTQAPPAPKPPKPRQTVLFSGLDCFPGQEDLFPTDGPPARTPCRQESNLCPICGEMVQLTGAVTTAAANVWPRPVTSQGESEMQISSPCEITPRLMPGLRIGGAFISIEYAERQDSARVRYQWYIDLPDGQEFSGDDLQSGCGPAGLQSGLESLLSFLSACGEAMAYSDRSGHESENADLFPRDVAEWAARYRDELGMAEIELQETPDVITE